MNEPITYVVKKKKEKKKRNFFVVLLKLLLILIILLLIGILALETYAFFYLKNVYSGITDEFEKLMIGIDSNYANSVVLDKDGNTLAILNGDEKRQIITIDEMPEYLKKAYISIEDERFYEHYGIDLKRTAYAAYTYVKNEGSSSFGGSTITQQLVKNITNNKENTVERKVKEWALAYELEQNLSKDKILEKYLNIIFVGGDVYGVELGSKYYFNKSASELSLAESAFLAGITHSPNLYNPFENLDNENLIKNRTKTVLGKMLELEAIEPREYLKAIDEVNNGLKFNHGNENTTIYSYHTDAAINQVIKDYAEKNEISEALAKSYIYSNGLTIYTTQDTAIQNKMEDEFKNTLYVIPSNIYPETTTQAAMVIIDHKTGYVVGCVGGLGEKNVSRGLNRATQSTRQTGSSMKPISVVAPALQEKIITAASIYNDSKSTFKLKTGEEYSPKNYNYYRGNITVRQALETSQNIPFVKIMEQLTPDKSKEYLIKMGITSLTQNDSDLAMAIGGLDVGISPLEMAAAYATFANDGVYIEPTFYTKVEDLNGNIILEAEQTKTEVLDKATAYVMKNLLTQPVKGAKGTATYCAINGMDVAAKTGTTDKDYDRWLCGFTPYYTAATWFGYDYNETIIYHNYQNPAAVIWSAVMNKVHEGYEPATFDVPEGVVWKKVCKTTGKLATKGRCWSTYEEVFSENNLPEQCQGHYRRYTSSSTNVTQNNAPTVTVTDERTGNSTQVQIPNN